MHCGTANTHDMQALVQTDTQSSTVSDRGVMQALVAYKQCKQKEMRRHCGAEKVNWKCKCIGLQTDAERDVQTLVIARVQGNMYAVIWWDANKHRDGISSKCRH